MFKNVSPAPLLSGTFGGEGDLRAWLFTILHNQYVNEVRRSPRTRRMVVFDEDLPRWLPAIQEKRHELRDLDRALAQLSAGQRAVILLVGWEGISYRDVSAILGITRGTVRSRLSRARGALRCLRPTAPTPLLD